MHLENCTPKKSTTIGNRRGLEIHVNTLTKNTTKLGHCNFGTISQGRVMKSHQAIMLCVLSGQSWDTSTHVLIIPWRISALWILALFSGKKPERVIYWKNKATCRWVGMLWFLSMKYNYLKVRSWARFFSATYSYNERQFSDILHCTLYWR